MHLAPFLHVAAHITQREFGAKMMYYRTSMRRDHVASMLIRRHFMSFARWECSQFDKVKKYLNECLFTSFLIVFQLCQDDESVIMKSCVQWNIFCDWTDSRLQQSSDPEPLDQQASA